MQTIDIGESVDVDVGVNRSVGVLLSVGVKAATSSVPETGIRNVLVERGITNTDVGVGTAGGASAPTIAPTITRLATTLAARTVITMRCIVMRIRISFSQCMDHLYSSGLGHWS